MGRSSKTDLSRVIDCELVLTWECDVVALVQGRNRQDGEGRNSCNNLPDLDSL